MLEKKLWKMSVAVCLLLPSLAFSENNATVQLNEVTVTGEKIERSLQETTTAVSVFKGDTIDASQTKSAYDVASQVPNMINNPSDLPVIRGVSGAGPASGMHAFISGARPRISTSVDGLSEGWSGQRYLDIGAWDIEQIEVLRGPQSTTQGRNSIGGAVVINTKDPTFEPEGAVRIGYENEDDKALLAAMISGPIVEDELALRLAAQGVYGHGFINYTGASTPWDASEIKQGSVRGKMLWIPKDIEGLIVKTTVSHRSQEGEYMNEISNPDISLFQDVVTSSNPVRYTDTTTTTVSVDVEYAINDDLKLYTLLGHSDYKASFEQATLVMPLDLDEKSTTFETRLVHDPKGGLLTSMVGLYFYNRTQDIATDGMTLLSGDDEIKTAALFTEESLHVSDSLDIIFGGRVEREHQERDVSYKRGANMASTDTDTAETVFLPKVGLNYKLTSEHNLGFTIRKGYTPGGGSIYVSAVPYTYYEFDKEEVWTYEATTRSLMLNKSLTLNTNLFYNDYDGYQGLLSNRITNIPEGKSYGFEAEASYRLSSDLELHGGFGLLRSEITEAPTGTNYKGNEFNYAPHFTGNVGFTQHFGGGFFFGSDLSYVGEYYSGIDNNEAYIAGKYTLVNANVGYETKSYTIRTYVKNALDEDVLYSYRGTNLQVGQPRTFGVTFDYRF